MTKKQRIEQLERDVADLKKRVADLERGGAPAVVGFPVPLSPHKTEPRVPNRELPDDFWPVLPNTYRLFPGRDTLYPQLPVTATFTLH